MCGLTLMDELYLAKQENKFIQTWVCKRFLSKLQHCQGALTSSTHSILYETQCLFGHVLLCSVEPVKS